MKVVLPLEQTRVSQNDLCLLQEIASGKQDAMASLYDRYSSPVYTAALNVLEQVDLAEETLRAVFLQVWRSPELFLVYGELLGPGWFPQEYKGLAMGHRRRW